MIFSVNVHKSETHLLSAEWQTMLFHIPSVIEYKGPVAVGERRRCVVSVEGEV